MMEHLLSVEDTQGNDRQRTTLTDNTHNTLSQLHLHNLCKLLMTVHTSSGYYYTMRGKRRHWSW